MVPDQDSRVNASADSACRCGRWSNRDGRDVPAFHLNDGGLACAVREFGRQFGRLAWCQLDPIVGPEDGGDQAARWSARGGTDLKRERVRWILEAQANGMAFDFGMCFHLRLRQARESRQIFMASAGVRV